MPPQAANDNEPPVMTWLKATPVLAVCVIFYLLCLFFDFFWLTGPALAGTAVGAWLSQYVGTFLGSLAGGVVAIGAGLTLGFAFTALGIIMAMLVAAAGWGTVLTLLVVNNHRIFKVRGGAFIKIVFGWAVSEVPLINIFPSMVFTIGRMYHKQIKTEKAAHALWQREHERAIQEQRAEEQAAIATRRAQIAAAEQAAANDNEAAAVTAEERGAANDNEEIPSHERLVA